MSCTSREFCLEIHMLYISESMRRSDEEMIRAHILKNIETAEEIIIRTDKLNR